MKRPTITAAIIAWNEQRNLPGLLQRLDWVDEIVLVDGGSNDATRQIAEQAGCRLFVRQMDSFSQQRNYALDQARGDWVLSIDADERPTAALAAEIRRVVALDRYAAYRLPIRSRIFGHAFRHSGTQDDAPLRLFRRGAARWIGLVHERLEVRGRVARLQHWAEHETLPDLAAFRVKMDRYTDLEARARVAAGRAPAWYQALFCAPREVFRRLVWKQGLLDGPPGWRFCVLSGWSEWVLACKHRRLWRQSRGGERLGCPEEACV